jgi:hypothetical protein
MSILQQEWALAAKGVGRLGLVHQAGRYGTGCPFRQVAAPLKAGLGRMPQQAPPAQEEVALVQAWREEACGGQVAAIRALVCLQGRGCKARSCVSINRLDSKPRCTASQQMQQALVTGGRPANKAAVPVSLPTHAGAPH